MKRTLTAFFATATLILPADLPVRTVILYKHGVGFFERSGNLAAGESARLDFKEAEMNDVLKSLTIQEGGGGKIRGLRYDSSLPLSKKLEAFPFEIKPGDPLTKILDQLKGSEVEIKGVGGAVKGVIVGARELAGNQTTPARQQITLLVADGYLETLDLSAAGPLRFTDAVLQEQFKRYLTELAGARSLDKRSVYIDSTDSKSRQVTAGYMAPMPVWKSSYRMIFAAAGQPTLEGWAIVDNTTSEDWTNVTLSLVSGRPISFISQLYAPKFVTRPGAELAEEQAQAPVLYDAAMSKAMAPPPSPSPAARGRAGAAGGLAMMEQMGMASRTESFSSSVGPTAQTREAGELFEYRLPTTVTVRKNESAMLPFLQQKIDARKLLIYTSANPLHPLNAAELTNGTGKTLDGGPITVYDGGVYGGEALMETLKAGDKRLISYAVDLGTRVTTLFDSKSETVREIHARRGILETRLSQVEVRTYTVFNADAKPKTLIVEHAARPGYELTGVKPAERTANAYRFEVKLAGNATEKLPVTEERVYSNTLALTNMTHDILLTYIQNKALTDAGRRQLQQIADQKQKIADAETEVRNLQSELGNLNQDQERTRQNIQTLNSVSGQQQQVQTYAAKLSEQNAQLAALRDRQVETQRRQSALEKELGGMIQRMSF